MTRSLALLPLLVLALLALPHEALAQQSFTDLDGSEKPADFAPAPTTHASLPGLTFFTDRAAFDAETGPLGASEDFSGTLVGPGGVSSCGGTLNSTTNDACFPSGGVVDGFSFDNIFLVPPVDDYVVVGPGFLSASTYMVGPNTFGDDSRFTFDDGPAAVGFNIATLDPGTFTIEVFGAGGSLGSTTISPAGLPAGGSFFGVIADEAITQIDVTNTTNEAELFSDLTFGALGLRADAGPNQRVEATGPDGALVQLDGSASTGIIADYEWTLVNGGAFVASGPTPEVQFDVGSRSLYLTVTEGAPPTAAPGDTDSDRVRIRVVDTTPPAITLVDGDEIDVPRFSGPFVDPGFSAYDIVDETVPVTDGGDEVDTNTVGVYIRTYAAVDAAGNTSEATRTVNVIDDPGAFLSDYGILTDTRTLIHSPSETEGDLHTNGSTRLWGGSPSTHIGNATAVVLLDIHNGNWVDGDVRARRVLIGAHATVTGTVTNSPAPSVPLPSVAVWPGTRDVKLFVGETRHLAPGDYAKLRLPDGSALTLEPGDYTFTSISMAVGTSITASIPDGPISIGVDGPVIIRDQTWVGVGEGDVDARYLSIEATGHVTIDDGAYVGAQVIAPYGPVRVGRDSRVVGPIVGARFEMAPGSAAIRVVERDGCAGPGPYLDCPVEATADSGPETAAAPIASSSSALPGELALAAPYPNPARGQATVAFDVPETAPVRVVVYDVVGREVAVLADGPQEPGTHRATVHGADLPSGVYIVRMTSGSFVATQRLTVVR
ncbi:immunoglobulin-like domain-containing protein [Rubrivirga sp. IMCC45206]|uniref:T9SS type A sorting domain-containing protein n=1 Tax=Rubrivirga sp. IMCC45206 TaxID=3391614 RepID=UPI00398FA4EB